MAWTIGPISATESWKDLERSMKDLKSNGAPVIIHFERWDFPVKTPSISMVWGSPMAENKLRCAEKPISGASPRPQVGHAPWQMPRVPALTMAWNDQKNPRIESSRQSKDLGGSLTVPQ